MTNEKILELWRKSGKPKGVTHRWSGLFYKETSKNYYWWDRDSESWIRDVKSVLDREIPTEVLMEMYLEVEGAQT